MFLDDREELAMRLLVAVAAAPIPVNLNLEGGIAKICFEHADAFLDCLLQRRRDRAERNKAKEGT